MSAVVRISHTQKELFLNSPRAWFNKYMLGLKEEVMGSPLFFGSNVEVGVEVLLQGGSLEEAHKAFEKAMKRYQVNGKWVDLATSDKVRYNKADFHEHLFTAKELDDMSTKTQQFKAHQSLIRSGKMMITEFHEKIQPNIKKVISTQEYFCIKNPVGDEIMGYADIICEWEDGRLLVPDLKTSSQPYKADAVQTMEKGSQTAIYYEALKEKYPLDGTGFLVLEKKVRKREPQMRSQIILDTPSDEIIDKTLDQYDQVIHDIKQGYFPCKSPECNRFGQKCCYNKFCGSEGTDMTGLVKFSRRK